MCADEVEDSETIERYLDLDERALYMMIPAFLPEYESVLFSPDGQEEAGEGFFKARLEELRRVVCQEFDWPRRRGDPKFENTTTLVAVIADAIAIVVAPVPPFVIGTLLVKMGLDQLCAPA